jgi:hypothetical protein
MHGMENAYRTDLLGILFVPLYRGTDLEEDAKPYSGKEFQNFIPATFDKRAVLFNITRI